MTAFYQLGRKPRIHDPRVPHMSSLMASRWRTAPVTPPHCDYAARLPPNVGMMLNDEWGDCTCAGYYHGRQVWSINAEGKEDTEPDKDVLLLYEKACGFDPHAGPPGSNPTDQGGVEQTVLTYLVKHGAPLGAGLRVDKLLAFVEIDPRNFEDVKRGIYECGFAYIGFQVPQYLLPADGSAPPTTWDLNPNADNTIIGGHAVILPGYMTDGAFRTISWGSPNYTMTDAFFDRFVDEVYALADTEWINATGLTPCGLTVAQLESQMKAIAA